MMEVFPAPRKPVNTVMGMFFVGIGQLYSDERRLMMGGL